MTEAWAKFYPSDWLAGTRELSLEESGLYITLIAMMYERGGPVDLPVDRLARLCGTRPSTLKKILAGLIDAGKLVETEHGLSNARAEKEIKNREFKSASARRSVSKRWEKDEEKQPSADTNVSETYYETDTTRNQIPETRKNNKNNTSELDLGGERKPPTPPPDDGPTLDQLWAEYPHPRSRGGKPAEKFAKLSASDRRQFREAIPALKASLAADRNRGFDRQAPMFQTYLNQRRWVTELEAGPPRSPPAAEEWSPFRCGP